ncbi:MAG: hypothetical protein Q8R39_02690 [bacterium]|nr:hypothetical protein [bacterium]
MRTVAEWETTLKKGDGVLRLMTRFDADTGEPLSWALRKDLSSNIVLIDREYARAQACVERDRFLRLASGVAESLHSFEDGPSVELIEPVRGERRFAVSWTHRVDSLFVADPLLVEDDHLTIEIDPTDGDVVSLAYEWHAVTPQTMPLSEEEAYRHVLFFSQKPYGDLPTISVGRKVFGSLRYVPVLENRPKKNPVFRPMWFFRVLEHDNPDSHFWDVYVDQKCCVYKFVRSR